MSRNALIELRRDTAANWTANNPVLALGEPGYEKDTFKLKVGDGATAWNSLSYLTASGGGGAGTVTTVSVVTANGISGSVANATTTPAITLSLGAITPSSVAATGTVAGSNLSGTNTGDQTITLTGHVTGSGTSSFATTIAAGVVSLSMLANMATASVFYRKTAGTGAPEVQTLATLKTDLGLTGTNSGDQTITLTGNVTGSGTGSFATTIAANAVTRAMMANTSAATVLGSTAAGAVAELTASQGRTVLGLGTGALINIAVGTSAPGSPATGDLWVDTN